MQDWIFSLIEVAKAPKFHFSFHTYHIKAFPSYFSFLFKTLAPLQCLYCTFIIIVPWANRKQWGGGKIKISNYEIQGYFQPSPFLLALSTYRQKMKDGFQRDSDLVGLSTALFFQFPEFLLFHSEMKTDRPSDRIFFHSATIWSALHKDCLAPNFYQILQEPFTSPAPPVTSHPLAWLVLLTMHIWPRHTLWHLGYR